MAERKIVRRVSSQDKPPQVIEASSVDAGLVIGALEPQDQSRQSFVSRHKWPLSAGGAVFFALGGAVAAFANNGDGDGKAKVTFVDPTVAPLGTRNAEEPSPTAIATRTIGVVATVKPDETTDGKDSGTSATSTPIPPTVRPTEVPPTPESIKLKTILDQPVVPTTIASIKLVADGFYAVHPEASDWRQSNGGVFTKQYLDANLNSCELGSPEDRGNASTLRASRETACFFVVINMYGLYVQHGYPEFLEIALGARNSFETAYPERKAAFEAGLRARGVN